MAYDPRVLSYGDLLEAFWEAHDASLSPPSWQYASLVFAPDMAARREAEASRERAAARLGRRVRTEILPAGPFYPAEPHHQKYFLRQSSELWRALRAFFDREEDFRRSPAVMRANAYLGGIGTPEGFARDLPRLGLAPHLQAMLQRFFRGAW